MDILWNAPNFSNTPQWPNVCKHLQSHNSQDFIFLSLWSLLAHHQSARCDHLEVTNYTLQSCNLGQMSSNYWQWDNCFSISWEKKTVNQYPELGNCRNLGVIVLKEVIEMEANPQSDLSTIVIVEHCENKLFPCARCKVKRKCFFFRLHKTDVNVSIFQMC